MKSFFQDVRDFHRKFGLLPKSGPAMLLDSDTLSFRTKFMVEELQEFRDACAGGDLPKAADALVDLCYVALGTAVLMRVPFDECWAAVQAANMLKERAKDADDSRSTRKHRLDVVKPEGWQPPDIEKVLAGVAASAPSYSRDKRMMRMARWVADEFSKDPSTKVGAVVVGRDKREIAIGYNGFPPGIADDNRLNDRETRYALTQHAERNVLDNATFDLEGATLYTTVFPCVDCAKSIISKKIARVVSPPAPAPTGEEIDFRKTVTLADQIMKEAGVQIFIVE